MNALRCFSFTHLAAFYFHFIAIVHCILHEPWKWDKEKKRVKYLIWLNVELISFKLLLCLAFNRQVNTELKLSLQKDSLKIRGKFLQNKSWNYWPSTKYRRRDSFIEGYKNQNKCLFCDNFIFPQSCNRFLNNPINVLEEEKRVVVKFATGAWAILRH